MNVAAELPKYRCHKEVHALKIKSVVVTPSENGEGDQADLYFEDGFAPIRLISGYDRFKFEDSEGEYDLGYYVVYADGWRSWSPTKAFEDGYTRI